MCVYVGRSHFCQARPEHPALAEALKPFLALEAKVKRMARMRLSYEKLESCEDVRDTDGERMQLVVGGAAIVVVTHWCVNQITTPGKPFYQDPDGYAVNRFAYYPCSVCDNPYVLVGALLVESAAFLTHCVVVWCPGSYYGGLRVCGPAGEEPAVVNKSELVCPSCQPHSEMHSCPKHGTEFIEFKCRYCCSTAVSPASLAATVHHLVDASSRAAVAFVWGVAFILPGVLLLWDDALLRAVPQATQLHAADACRRAAALPGGATREAVAG